jgi:hypothetical protein
VFDTKPIPFAVRRPLVDLEASKHLGWGVSLWIACDDADGLHKVLADAGVPISASPADGPFGRFFVFEIRTDMPSRLIVPGNPSEDSCCRGSARAGKFVYQERAWLHRTLALDQLEPACVAGFEHSSMPSLCDVKGERQHAMRKLVCPSPSTASRTATR